MDRDPGKHYCCLLLHVYLAQPLAHRNPGDQVGLDRHTDCPLLLWEESPGDPPGLDFRLHTLSSGEHTRGTAMISSRARCLSSPGDHLYAWREGGKCVQGMGEGQGLPGRSLGLRGNGQASRCRQVVATSIGCWNEWVVLPEFQKLLW